jgi:hypothetical protein
MQQITVPQPPPAPRVTIAGAGESPTAVYRAQVAQRKELGDQLDRLQDTRRELSSRLQEEPPVTGADRAGIEARIAGIDARIADVDKQIAAADQAVARAAGIPGAVVEETHFQPRPGPPEEVYVLTGLFMFVAILPISIAYARRIWRRSAAAVSALPDEVMDRLTRLDHAVDSIAVEVERIGEGQRFVTRVLADRSPAGAALDAGPERGPR